MLSRPPLVGFSKSSHLAPLVGVAFASLALLGGERPAEASGYLAARFGSDHGTPAMANTYAIYFNPAALGGTTGSNLTLDLSLAFRWASYSRTQEALSPSDPSTLANPDYRAANTGNATLVNLLALPFLGVTTDFGMKNNKTIGIHGGFATYVPFGGLATWNKRDDAPANVPGATDGVQRWHNISGQILAIYNTLAASFTIKPLRLSIGASLSAVIHHVATVRARNLDGSDDTLIGNTLIEGRSLINVWGLNFGASFGAYFEPLEDRSLRIGYAYLTQPGFGETRMSGTLKQTLGTAKEDSTPINLLQEYPDIHRIGVSWRATKRVELRSDFEYVRWSTFTRQCVVREGQACDVAADGADQSNGKVILNIPRNWNDAVGFRIGGSYFISDSAEVFFGTGFTTSAVPKTTIDASTIDAFRLYFTGGAKFQLSKHWGVAASYNHIAFLNVNTNGANDLNGFKDVSRSPSGDGVYRAVLGLVNLNVNYTF